MSVPSADYLATEAGAVTNARSTVVTTELGDYLVQLSTDNDGHLTVIVKSTDGSQVADVEDEVGCNVDELGYRFTTEKIEAAVQ